MGSSITRTPLSPSFFTKPVNSLTTNLSFIQLQPPKPFSKNPQFLMSIFNPTSVNKSNPQISPLSCLTIDHFPTIQQPTVSQKVQTLDFEFKSLPEPIDRVKRLLQYATILPPFDESSRIQENRVVGCTAQVWLEARMDLNGLMRFRVDTDSEIIKGFCSCLIWVLDGAGADEVLSVKTEDLVGMNVGLPSRGNSRVNTWHNVLISMQRRTEDLVEERDRARGDSVVSFDNVSSLIAVNGSCKNSQLKKEGIKMSFYHRKGDVIITQACPFTRPFWTKNIEGGSIENRTVSYR